MLLMYIMIQRSFTRSQHSFFSAFSAQNYLPSLMYSSPGIFFCYQPWKGGCWWHWSDCEKSRCISSEQSLMCCNICHELCWGAISRCPNIRVLLATAKDIDNFSKSHTLEETYQLATAGLNTQAIHCVDVLSDSNGADIACSLWSTATDKQINLFKYFTCIDR
jgi:hypothetical protein